VERTESVVIQVAPAYENQKIQEMQVFGWNLQGRQEIHEEGDAYGRPSYLSDNTYIIKTKVSHYVKLHFSRSVSLPNVDKIRVIENEYNSLPFPSSPSLMGPGCVIVFFGIGVIIAFAMMSQSVGTGFGLLAVYGAFVALGIWWLRKNQSKGRDAQEICKRSVERAQQLLMAAKELGELV